jgi:hypothetical protein
MMHRLLLVLLSIYLIPIFGIGQMPGTSRNDVLAGIRVDLSSNGSRDTTFGSFSEISPIDSVFVTSDTTDFWVIATAATDYDNDGDLDIAVLGYYVIYNVSATDRFILMKNDSLGADGRWAFTYIDIPLDSLTAGASDMAWGDADGDGDLDLALGSDGITVLYRNDSGSLVMTDTQLPGYWEENSQAYFNLHSISWADYDNDGDLDLLIPSVFDFNSFSYKTPLMRNDGPNGSGGWIFSETDSVFAGTSHAQSSWADYDNDGDLDLLLVNISPVVEDGFIRRYRNDGEGIFTGEDVLGALTIEHGELQWGDYDADGDLDILMAGNVKEINGTYTPMALRVYQNDNDIFTPYEVVPEPFSEGWWDFTAATWADYDSDGDVDILLAGHYNSGEQIEGRARIYANTGNQYAPSGSDLPAPHAAGDRAGTFSWLDIDTDGDLDYFIAGEYFVPAGNGLVEAQMHLYRNDVEGQNLAPMAPTGITVTQVNDSTTLLEWVPASDDHTPSVSLTYDLKLFRDNVPFSLPERIPEPGNVSSTNHWLFTGLDAGNYSWTLSAVDASYMGSTVATGEFAIGVTGLKDPLNTGPAGFSLGPCFPNPASGKVTLNYSISEDVNVAISIFDLHGNAVSSLVDENKDAGNYQLTFDACRLPDGVYFVRMIVGNVSLSEKLILLK